MNRFICIKFFKEGIFKGFYTESTDYTKYRTTDGKQKLDAPVITYTRPTQNEPELWAFTKENYEWVQGVVRNLKVLTFNEDLTYIYGYDVVIGLYECFDHFTGEEDFLNVKSEIANSCD